MPKASRRSFFESSLTPEVILREAIKAPDAPGVSAVTLGEPQPAPVEAPDDPFLPPMTAQIYDRVFKPVEGPPIDQGFAMHLEDVTAVGGDRGKVVRLAQQFQGTPYVWGGTDPDTGFDCSGFVQYVYKHALGIDLPRISWQQADAGQRIGLGHLKSGDLVAWDNSSRNNGADHIAIYLGQGLIAEAPRPGVPLRIRKLGNDEGAWGVRILGDKRG